ncbi:MAG: signal peptidase II [Gammaproteobacteria bacterium]
MKWLWLSALVVALDQFTKYLAVHYLQLHASLVLLSGLNLTLTHNTGAAFSMLSRAGGWQRWFFILLAITVSIAIIIWLHHLSRQRRWMACCLALILGGALGNLCDRLMLGYVIDFIDVYYKHLHWPAFNVADSAITIGAIMLIIDSVWFTEEKME